MGNQEPDLQSAESIDLAAVALDFEGFRRLCQNSNLTANERIGFPDSYREGFESAIFDDILAKLPILLSRDKVVVDIGPGCANLPHIMIDFCARQGHKLVLVDSVEMLNQLPDTPLVSKTPGAFPRNLEAIRNTAGGTVDAILCYSVLHYMYVDTNLFDVVDATMSMLSSGGAALFGDIPNVSKRKRFFSSETGIKFHTAYMNTNEPPDVKFNVTEMGRIDDSVLSALVHRCQVAGCDAYILPQPAALPMANRRDDLLIRKP